MTRKALGRGLNALLRETEEPTPVQGLQEIDLSLIDPNPFQPRTELSENSLQELADSIRSTGVLQPVLVRPAGERYQLVAGERRWRAASKAGLEKIPATIRSIEDVEALELALVENLLREALSPLEIAHAYDQLQQTFHLTHEQIAERLGVNRTTVTNTLRLLGLPLEVQKLLSEGKITAGHARALVAVTPEEAQGELAQLVIEKNLSVRSLENLIASKARRKLPVAAAEPSSQVDPNLRVAVIEMERTLGTRVRIVGGEKRGKIEISYYSPEDLNRIYDWILRT